MSSDLNKVMLIGRLGKDPEGNEMPSGAMACNFSLATGEKWKDKQTGEMQERVEWHRVSVFGALADICLKYLKKGSQVYVEGSNRTRKWTDKQGIERYTTEVICHEMKMLGSKGDSGGGNKPPPHSEAPAGARSSRASAGGSGAPRDDIDDDIPF